MKKVKSKWLVVVLCALLAGGLFAGKIFMNQEITMNELNNKLVIGMSVQQIDRILVDAKNFKKVSEQLDGTQGSADEYSVYYVKPVKKKIVFKCFITILIL